MEKLTKLEQFLLDPYCPYDLGVIFFLGGVFAHFVTSLFDRPPGLY
jgi:hypothetical protein